MTAIDTRSRNGRLREAIVQRIELRTWNRIHCLRVEVRGGHVAVHGRVPSYHIKQLALLGVMDVLGSIDPDETELDIEVGWDGRARSGSPAAWATVPHAAFDNIGTADEDGIGRQ